MSRRNFRGLRVVVSIALTAISIIPVVGQAPVVRPVTWAMRTELGTLENCYLISDGFYRSEQPSKTNMKAVESTGIKTLVNLRNVRKDNRKSRGTQLQLVHVPINTWRMSYDDVVNAMKAIDTAEKPVLL